MKPARSSSVVAAMPPVRKRLTASPGKRLPKAPPQVPRRLRSKDFLSVLDLEAAELQRLLDLASAMKRDRAAGRPGPHPLAGKHIAMLFEKPSLRTRITFMIAVRELGGEPIEAPADSAFGGREALEDIARNLERWLAGAIVRTYAQARLERFASAAPRLHVVNALTNEEHPCQALADMLALRERIGDLAGRTLAFVGDGNNVAASVAQAGAMLGLRVRVASPPGFELPPAVLEGACRAARRGGSVECVRDPGDAVRGADAIYTDVWASMGQEHEAEAREAIFRPYQVNQKLMARAATGAVFMHCLPAHRGLEVTDAVLDSSSSLVLEQAENRLHTQKALLALLIG
jgi:ornithine carbamoyltransferase